MVSSSEDEVMILGVARECAASKRESASKMVDYAFFCTEYGIAMICSFWPLTVRRDDVRWDISTK